MSKVNSLYFILDQVVWNADKIKLILERNPSEINKVNHDRESPLFRVLKNDNCSVDLVQVLLHYGAEVNCINKTGETPLMVALYHSRDNAIIKTLLEKGADAKVRHHITGSTILCYALRCSVSKDIVKLLLDSGCNPNACRKHVSALHCASDSPKDTLGEGILELLFNAGANLLKFEPNRQSSVCLALQAGAGAKDIEWLLTQRASLDACTMHNCIWLCATDNRRGYNERKLGAGAGWGAVLRSDVVALLAKEGAGTITDRSKEHLGSPFHLALSECKYETRAIKMLLDFPGVDANVRNTQQENLLHSAVENWYCKPSAIRLLIERGTKVDGVNTLGQTPLHAAIFLGPKTRELSVQLSIISILLKNNSPVNARDMAGDTPLRYAVKMERHSDLVQLLLSAGARIGFPNGRHFLLNLALNQYLETKRQFTLESLKLLVKYYFLEDPGFKIESLTRGRSFEGFHTELKNLSDACVREVQIMKSTVLDYRRSLLDMIGERSFPRIVAADKNPALSSDSFNNVLRIMADNKISHFFTDISVSVGKSVMDIKLKELQVYSIKKFPVSSRVKKVILIHDCVCEMTPFLNHADIMRLILAFCVIY